MKLSRRTDDARLDMAIHDAELRHAGVVEDDEPTPYSHAVHMERYWREARGELTPAEREAIRAAIGLGPFAPSAVPTDMAREK